MKLRVLDLDGSIVSQKNLLAQHSPQIWHADEWGKRIRMASSFPRFRRFEHHFVCWLNAGHDVGPAITFYGSGDFHHVTLALVRRLRMPVNLLVIDNPPDWMRGVPFMHCGTWLCHAARLPHV